MSQEWRESLKAGDAVFVSHAFGGGYDAYKVERVTPTQIVLPNGMKFRKDDGGSVGTDTWHHTYIAEPTPERIAEYKREKAISRIEVAASKFSVPQKFSTELIEEIDEFFIKIEAKRKELA